MLLLSGLATCTVACLLRASHLCLPFQGQYLANRICSAMVTSRQSLVPLSHLSVSWVISSAYNICSILQIQLFLEQELLEGNQILRELSRLCHLVSHCSDSWSFHMKTQENLCSSFPYYLQLWPMSYDMQGVHFNPRNICAFIWKWGSSKRRTPGGHRVDYVRTG